jgi:uncharacterized cupin superfamily protein
MTIVNLNDDHWDSEREQPGYDMRRRAVAAALGGELLGASLFELPPGQRAWPYHTHYGNEELLIVIGGTPTLRTPEGERELRAGDVAIHRRGPDGFHQMINRSESVARFLVVSTMIEPDIVQWEDSDKLRVFAGAAPQPGTHAPIELSFRRTAAIPFWEGESPPPGG